MWTNSRFPPMGRISDPKARQLLNFSCKTWRVIKTFIRDPPAGKTKNKIVVESVWQKSSKHLGGRD